MHAATNETLYQTSFEAPAFTPGLPIRGQDNWQMFHDGEAISVATNNARTGAQCVRFEGALLEQTGPNASRAYCFSRALEGATNPAPIVEIRASVRLDGPRTGTNGTPNQDILSANLMAAVSNSPTTATYLGGFFVSSAGRIWNYSPVPGESYKVSLTYTSGTYRTLALRVDFVARRLTYLVDGVTLGSSPFPPGIVADRLYSGYLELSGPIDPINTPELTYDRNNYTAYFDDYSFVSIPLSPVNAVIEFAATNVLADEFRTMANLTVIRRGFTNAAVRVTVSTTNDTAKAGEDFEAVSTFVTFAAGETNKVVEIPLRDDYWPEPDKSFLARISGLPPGATSPNSTASVLIRDDDRPGSIDWSWSSTLGLPPLAQGEQYFANVEALWRQPNGRLLVSVGVYNIDFLPSYYFLVRLNSDGSVDPTYPIRRSMPHSPSGSIYFRRTVMMPDGRLLVLDHEDTGPGTIEIRLSYVLNPDGSQDDSFPTISGSADYDLIPQADGKLLVSGNNGFLGSAVSLNGQRMPPYFRLNSDGTLDTAFNAPTNLLGKLRLLTNGQIYLEANYAPPYRLYRLNDNGSLDSSFSAPTNVALEILHLLSNGRILAQSYQGQPQKLYRLEPNGSLPAGYTVGTAAGQPAAIFSIVEQGDGKIVVAGVFRTFNGQVRNSIVRLNTNGVIDTTFQSGTGFTTGDTNTPAQVRLSVRFDGTMIASEFFDFYNGEKVTSPIAINPDGTRNRDFSNEGTSIDYGVFGGVSPLPALFLNGQFIGEPLFATGYGLGRIRTELPLRIVSTERSANGATHLTANALAGRSYTLQASEDLAHWGDLATQPATTNRIVFTDGPVTPPGQRFYRLRQN